MSQDKQDMQAWVGRQETNTDWVTPQLAQRLAATLESQRTGPWQKGGELPAPWYAVLFPRVVPRSQLGRDGHPALGDFLPPVPLPKRMFAGKRMQFTSPILLGDEIERVSTIASITPKQGSTGPLVFVTVKHEIRRLGGPLLMTEEQDVVYRTADSGAGAAKPKEAAKPFGAEKRGDDIVADPVLVFRYSALGFNGHRIHYDKPYVTEVEGYPGIVVNGGLSSMLALEHVNEAWGGRRLVSATARNTSPLFLGEAFHVESRQGSEPDTVEFRVVKGENTPVVVGTATLAGA